MRRKKWSISLGNFMPYTELSATAYIMVGLEASSKKQLFEKLATCAEDRTGLARREFFDAIMRRERLGSMAVGAGTSAAAYCASRAE